MSTRVIPAETLDAYVAHDRRVRVRYSKVSHVLVMLLVPAGTTLDWFVYPHLLWDFLVARLIVAALAAIGLSLHYVRAVQRNIGWFAMLVPLLANAAMSWMVFRSEGAASPYYAGLNLVVMGIGVLLPWSFGEAVIACVATIAFYGTAVAVRSDTLQQAEVLYNNLYFLVLTGIICSTSAYFQARARLQEFCLQSELAQSNRQLREVERLKTEFFANVSHELRTPLTLVLAPLGDVLERRETLTLGTAELLETARDNALRLLKLVNDLLEVIRLESSEVMVHEELIDFSRFVRTQCDSVLHLAGMKEITVTVQSDPTPVWVVADSVHLEKILVNVLTNGIKFTPRGGAVSVVIRREGDVAVAETSDTGIGISAEDLPFIFDRFRQADGAATRRFTGLGIGLALAKELAELCGGELRAESTPGRGTTVALRLPCRETAVGQMSEGRLGKPLEADDSLAQLFRDADRFVPVDPGAPESTAGIPFPDAPGSVLVIDDEPDMRRYLVATLSDEYTVLQAADGRAGLELARQIRPKLVIVDLMMPTLDGWKVCAQLKREAEEHGRPRILVVTARIDERSKVNALADGADDLLNKPFSVPELKARVANLYRAQELERSLRERNSELADTMQRLRAVEAQLVQHEKMIAVSRLAGGILHEINNPLNITLTAIGIALERVPATDAANREILSDVRSGMERIRDIVSDLRDFANPIHEDHRDWFDFGHTVDAALRLTSPQLRGIRVERQIDANCPTFGAESQLLQVLTNLVLNAEAALRRSSALREPCIRITAVSGADATIITVWDNGVGIPARLLAKIFDPFVTTGDVGEGMGLGLSICHALVAAHDGRITVHSEEGQWTEVRIELPQRRAEGAV